MSDKPETDAVKILHDRFIKGDPERLARLEIEREIADAQQETYDEYVPPLEKQVAELKAKLAEAEIVKERETALLERDEAWAKLAKVEKESTCPYHLSHMSWPPGTTKPCVYCERDALRKERDEAQAACAALMAVVQAAEHVAEWVENTKDEIQRKSEMSWLRRQYAMIRSGDKPFNDLSELVCRATRLCEKVRAMKGCK